MNPKDLPAATDPDPTRREPRLDSWKEIAAYLRRDVRTVQRWHQRAGLPVRHHADAKQRGVFAFPSALDEWANRVRAADAIPAESLAVDDHEPVERPEPIPRRATPTLLAGAGVLCVVIALAAWILWEPAAPTVPFQQRDWLVVAAFDNRAGDEGLEDTLRYALEREVGASAFVNVVPRERVQDVLRLMRRPEDSRLTTALAREVSVRDGNVKAVVTGAVDRLGTGYLVGVELADPHTGTTLRTRTERVRSQSELFDAMRRLAVWIRGALGERNEAVRKDALPRVTTASLSALRFYGKAQEAWGRTHFRAARVLLESAVREDPEFAAAHSQLAAALALEPNARTTLAAAIAHHDARALALSSHATEEERLRIVAEHHLLHVEMAKAVAPSEALVRLRPDDWEAHVTLGFLYYGLHRLREAVDEVVRAADLRPNDFRVAVRAAQAWVLWAGEPERARPYVERARALWPSQVAGFSAEPVGNLPPPYTRDVAWVLFFPAYDRWRAGDFEGMLAELRQVLETEPLARSNERDAFLTIAIALNMTAGRLGEARTLAGRMFQDSVRELHLAVVAETVDDFQTLRTHLSRIPPGVELRPLRYVRAGLYRDADDILARPEGRDGMNAAVARGELALRRGRRAEGVELLRSAIETTRNDTLSERYLAAESLATELARIGKQDEAINVLEDAAADVPRYARTGVSGAYWLRVLARLAQDYRNVGRVSDAETLEARLGKLLALGDADHPLLGQISQRQASSR